MSAIFGEVLTFGQQNGPDVRLSVFGDEHYARYENLDGYTVVYDEALGAVLLRAPLRGRTAGRPACRSAIRRQPGSPRHLQESRRSSKRKRGRESCGRRPGPAAVPTTRSCARSARTRGCSKAACWRPAPVRGLTILVNFQDVTSTVTRADVEEMLNGANYTRNGNICSAREYFRRVSSGKLDYTQRRRRSVSRSAAIASSTSTTCWSRKRCRWPSPTGST